MGVDDSGNNQDAADDRFAQHRNLRLRGNAPNLHRHGERAAKVGGEERRSRSVAVGVSVSEQIRTGFGSGPTVDTGEAFHTEAEAQKC